MKFGKNGTDIAIIKRWRFKQWKTWLNLQSRFYKVVLLHKTCQVVTIHNLFATFLQRTSAKNYESRLTYVKVINEDKVVSFHWYRTVQWSIVYRDSALRKIDGDAHTFEIKSNAVRRSLRLAIAMIICSGQCLETVHSWSWSCNKQ